MKIRLVLGELFHANVRTHMTELVVVFRSFVNAPKNASHARLERNTKHIYLGRATWYIEDCCAMVICSCLRDNYSGSNNLYPDTRDCYWILRFVDRASRYILAMKTNFMHYVSSAYFVSQLLHVSSIFVAHHMEVYCIYTTSGTCCASQLTVC